ncbi:TetR/AcrR family transcriptional regulator [Desulfosporosinus sp. PR]|uniref:TetR/AcrR family transcriptional regulator n=1 Tax=Candidatus Desulfosporosinus nitrosoreducens TaxID=3401928 RepID=UPI0027E5E3C4|nr:TetR/AcrR family transcriptional regulator [Desulfosporosinus sp. PR]MDQ7094682.1 TetR/AcrR family transcriptional regulator [Desulfosporosinus sp. PR]
MKEADRNRRRRGDALIESIYDATVEVIKEVGYANLTFQLIARAAKTSRTVLYRRWTTTLDLIHEIMAYKTTEALGGDLTDKLENTGSLRGDFLLLLTLYQRFFFEVGPEIMNAFFFELGQNSAGIAEIKRKATEKNILTMRKLLSFAQARGEKLKEVSAITLTLPFDLIRIEHILRQGTLDENQLGLLVEEILLPVFRA